MRLTRPCLLALAFRSHSRGHKVNPCSLLLSGTIRLTRSCLLVRLLPVLLGTALSRFLKVMRSFLLDRLLDELAHENTTRNKQFKQFTQLITHASTTHAHGKTQAASKRDGAPERRKGWYSRYDC
jgi:hypothetical protein